MLTAFFGTLLANGVTIGLLWGAYRWLQRPRGDWLDRTFARLDDERRARESTKGAVEAYESLRQEERERDRIEAETARKVARR